MGVKKIAKKENKAELPRGGIAIRVISIHNSDTDVFGVELTTAVVTELWFPQRDVLPLHHRGRLDP